MSSLSLAAVEFFDQRLDPLCDLVEEICCLGVYLMVYTT